MPLCQTVEPANQQPLASYTWQDRPVSPNPDAFLTERTQPGRCTSPTKSDAQGVRGFGIWNLESKEHRTSPKPVLPRYRGFYASGDHSSDNDCVVVEPTSMSVQVAESPSF